jgi:hypothetical protein
MPGEFVHPKIEEGGRKNVTGITQPKYFVTHLYCARYGENWSNFTVRFAGRRHNLCKTFGPAEE